MEYFQFLIDLLSELYRQTNLENLLFFPFCESDKMDHISVSFRDNRRVRFKVYLNDMIFRDKKDDIILRGLDHSDITTWFFRRRYHITSANIKDYLFLEFCEASWHYRKELYERCMIDRINEVFYSNSWEVEVQRTKVDTMCYYLPVGIDYLRFFEKTVQGLSYYLRLKFSYVFEILDVMYNIDTGDLFEEKRDIEALLDEVSNGAYYRAEKQGEYTDGQLSIVKGILRDMYYIFPYGSDAQSLFLCVDDYDTYFRLEQSLIKQQNDWYTMTYKTVIPPIRLIKDKLKENDKLCENASFVYIRDVLPRLVPNSFFNGKDIFPLRRSCKSCESFLFDKGSTYRIRYERYKDYYRRKIKLIEGFESDLVDVAYYSIEKFLVCIAVDNICSDDYEDIILDTLIKCCPHDIVQKWEHIEVTGVDEFDRLYMRYCLYFKKNPIYYMYKYNTDIAGLLYRLGAAKYVGEYIYYYATSDFFFELLKDPIYFDALLQTISIVDKLWSIGYLAPCSESNYKTMYDVYASYKQDKILNYFKLPLWWDFFGTRSGYYYKVYFQVMVGELTVEDRLIYVDKMNKRYTRIQMMRHLVRRLVYNLSDFGVSSRDFKRKLLEIIARYYDKGYLNNIEDLASNIGTLFDGFFFKHDLDYYCGYDLNVIFREWKSKSFLSGFVLEFQYFLSLLFDDGGVFPPLVLKALNGYLSARPVVFTRSEYETVISRIGCVPLKKYKRFFIYDIKTLCSLL